jgi:hypothetical protein
MTWLFDASSDVSPMSVCFDMARFFQVTVHITTLYVATQLSIAYKCKAWFASYYFGTVYYIAEA